MPEVPRSGQARLAELPLEWSPMHHRSNATRRVSSDRVPTVVDLFAGCGGMTAGFVQLRYEVLARISSRVVNDITSKPPGAIGGGDAPARGLLPLQQDQPCECPHVEALRFFTRQQGGAR